MTMSETNSTDFYIVDFDRTLVNSDKLFEVLLKLLIDILRFLVNRLKRLMRILRRAVTHLIRPAMCANTYMMKTEVMSGRA